MESMLLKFVSGCFNCAIGFHNSIDRITQTEKAYCFHTSDSRTVWFPKKVVSFKYQDTEVGSVLCVTINRWFRNKLSDYQKTFIRGN